MSINTKIWLSLLIEVLYLVTSCVKEEVNTIPPIIFNPEIKYGDLTDQEGNIYKTITIGSQVWMAENLKTAIYRNGDPIPKITDNSLWNKQTTGACCSYEYDDNYINNFGYLYNWYAVNDSRNIAPVGWHVPSRVEWDTLMHYVNYGGNLKEIGNLHWNSPNKGATDKYGFAALPVGINSNGFFQMGYGGHWWSTTEYTDPGFNDGWSLILAYSSNYHAFNHDNKIWGKSIRCVKD